MDGSSPLVSCENDTLTALYLTDRVYGEKVTDIPDDVKQPITDRLISKASMMSIIDATKTPP